VKPRRRDREDEAPNTPLAPFNNESGRLKGKRSRRNMNDLWIPDRNAGKLAQPAYTWLRRASGMTPAELFETSY
jgi:hypothetical protein